MSDFTIDKDIPAPPPKGYIKYPWREMEVGDSFFVPFAEATKHMQVSARVASKRTGFSFTSRKVDGGWRFWRIA